jgi:putative tricarboxylic transport membrane protein
MVATRVEPVADQRALARAHDLRIAARTFAAMAVFLGLAMVGGYLAATLVFTPAFLLYAARVRPRTAIVYTLVLGAVLLTLPSLLPVDLPMGLLQ